MIALVVVSGSALTGVGLGRFLTKVVLADATTQDGSNGTGAIFASTEDAAAAGVKVIYINPNTLNLHDPTLQLNSVTTAVTPVNPLPFWNYSATASAALGGATYSGSILGRSPFAHGKTTTTLAVQIIPLIITIDNGGADIVTYDPTVPDPCVPGSLTDVSVLMGSPIFQNTPWTMNGVSMGTTQYLDAFQRAQFWSLVQGTNYHLILSPTVLPAQTLTFGSMSTLGPGTNYVASSLVAGKCGNLGVVNINNLDAAVQTVINGPLAGIVNVGTFPIFQTKNVVQATSGTSVFSNCCVLGYHSDFGVGSNIQIYSPFVLDTTGIFPGGYTSVLSHELGEAINDPTVTNPTPPWGNIGQNAGGFCQNNFEVGDPLSPGFGTPTSPFTVTGGNGLSYRLQELAFSSWFYGLTPSLGAGGLYSNHGTFAGAGGAIICPPGGTH
jgi:hypothetical protein